MRESAENLSDTLLDVWGGSTDDKLEDAIDTGSDYIMSDEKDSNELIKESAIFVDLVRKIVAVQ